MRWNDLKKKGSHHYKTGKIEPIDLYKDGGILWDFAIGNIIKYAYRCRGQTLDIAGPSTNDLVPRQQLIEKDLNKIIHYVEMLRVIVNECKAK